MKAFIPIKSPQGGFTLVELLIAMVVATIMGGAMVANYISQQRSATIVREVAQMQQQLRGALYILEEDIRLAGYNPEMMTGIFGVTDIQPRSIEDGEPDAAGMASLTIAADWQPDPANPDWNDNGVLDNGEASTYFLMSNDRGSNDLFRRINGGNAELMAENMDQMAFAFAYENEDGEIARDGDDIIWAISNDGVALNRRLNDDLTDQDLGETVSLDRIRMVRVWLLARAQNQAQGYLNNEQYAIPGLGEDIATSGFEDSFRRRLTVRTIEMRNVGI